MAMRRRMSGQEIMTFRATGERVIELGRHQVAPDVSNKRRARQPQPPSLTRHAVQPDFVIGIYATKIQE